MSGPRITKRYAPPVRKSISQPGSVKPFGPHHCFRCPGSLQTLKTSSRGASKTRDRVISSTGPSGVSPDAGAEPIAADPALAGAGRS